MQTMAERIKARREALGFSLFDLSLRAKIPEQNLRLWEGGRKPADPEAIARLAEGLGTTTDYLIRGSQPKGAVTC